MDNVFVWMDTMIIQLLKIAVNVIIRVKLVMEVNLIIVHLVIF